MEKKEISKECKKYGIEVDQYVIAKDYEGLEDYLAKLKIISESHNSPEYAPIFYYLGTGNRDKGTTMPAHGSYFDVDEDSIPIGVAIQCKYIYEYLTRL